MAPNDTYDSDPATGSEIDIMEYVPFTGPNYSLMNLFHAAVIGDLDVGRAEPPEQAPTLESTTCVSTVSSEGRATSRLGVGPGARSRCVARSTRWPVRTWRTGVNGSTRAVGVRDLVAYLVLSL